MPAIPAHLYGGAGNFDQQTENHGKGKYQMYYAKFLKNKSIYLQYCVILNKNKNFQTKLQTGTN